VRFFRIPSFTGIESHRDDADRGSLRAIEGCLPHGPGGVRSAPVWDEVGDVDMFSETEYNMISAADDGNGNSLLFVSRLGQITDLAILSTENTDVGPFGANYLVSDSIVHNQKTGAISPIGDRKFAVGDGTAEAIYIGKGPPGGSASVFPDEILYRQEWSRFPNCKHYVQGPNKTIYAAGNPEKPLTVYVSEPAGSTNPHVDSPYSTELTPPANKQGKLSTVDILASKASKITALTSNGNQVIVHTDKGCHVLYAPSADQANTGYRVEQAPSSVFSAAVSPRTALSDNGSMIFWLGHDGQIYKDESAGRGSEDAKKFTDPGQANWKSKGIWEKSHPKDLSDSFSFYDPQSGYYWVFIRSLASLDYAGSLSPNRPTMLEALPAAPSTPGNLQTSTVTPAEPLDLIALPQAPAQPTNLQSLVQAPSAPTDLIALPTYAPAPPTNLVAFLNPPRTGPGSLVASLLPPVAGPVNLTTLEFLTPPLTGPGSLVASLLPPVAGPVNLTTSTNPPAAGPTNLNTSLLAPAAGPTNLNTSMFAPAAGPTNLNTSMFAPAAGPTNLNTSLLAPAAGPTNLNTSLLAPAAGPTNLNAGPSVFEWTQSDAYDEKDSLLGVYVVFNSSQTPLNSGDYTCGRNASNIVPATTQAELVDTGTGSNSVNPNMNAWYPDATRSARALSYNNGAGNDQDAVWVGFNYLDTRNLDDFNQNTKQWESISGTQHAWSFDQQWAYPQHSSPGGRTLFLVYNPNQGRYCVLAASWKDTVGGQAVNNGSYSDFNILSKLNLFDNATDANNPYGSYSFTYGIMRYSVHVGDGLLDSAVPKITSTTDTYFKYTIPNSNVQGLNLFAETNVVMSTF
jgi:hypothetical protein